MQSLPDDFADRLLDVLQQDREVLGPVAAADGVCRLQPVSRWDQLTFSSVPLIPLKKVLFPPRAPLWRLSGQNYVPPEAAMPAALVGVAPCDLYGLAYLDRVFCDDVLYLSRRQAMLVVGAECRPGPDCFCPSVAAPPPFDLYLAGGQVWAGTPQGEALLAGLGVRSAVGAPPLPATGAKRPASAEMESLFAASIASPLWRKVAERCVSCGACSAVCPTCYCFDVVDEVSTDGTLVRYREWDNCFFRNHALVAGGRNFRPDRAERLRFRFEHKFLGFGSLRGLSSCVGCGRCGRACPVGIDMSEVLLALAGEEKP